MGRKDDHGESIYADWEKPRQDGIVDEATYEEFSELYRGGKGFSSHTLFRDIMAEAKRTGSPITAEQVLMCLAEMDLE